MSGINKFKDKKWEGKQVIMTQTSSNLINPKA
jgi:hypothetical protein